MPPVHMQCFIMFAHWPFIVNERSFIKLILGFFAPDSPKGHRCRRQDLQRARSMLLIGNGFLGFYAQHHTRIRGSECDHQPNRRGAHIFALHGRGMALAGRCDVLAAPSACPLPPLRPNGRPNDQGGRNRLSRPAHPWLRADESIRSESTQQRKRDFHPFGQPCDAGAIPIRVRA